MAVDLQEILLGEQAAVIASAARAHANIMDLQERAYLAKLVKVDLAEAAAAKELAKSGMAVDLAGIRPPALPDVK